jgi:hypothetical protein
MPTIRATGRHPDTPGTYDLYRAAADIADDMVQGPDSPRVLRGAAIHQ